ncbi:hypothetical protein ACIPVB_10075 [Microbacterium sp. NPDC090007]|uniref:hypothetical protein n=1 Tax=Microbacterium sp. NPDC090007 TaxID=3364204 RepID=UPI0037F77191
MPRLSAVALITAAAVLAPATLPSAGASPARAASGVTCPTAAPSAAATGAVDMSATVIGPPSSQSSPCRAASAGASGAGAPAKGAAGGTGVRAGSGAGTAPAGSGSETVSIVSPSPSPAPGAVDLGGVVHVGGLLSNVRISPNPFGGSAALSFTVRNVSTSTFDATADFWMEGPLGNRVAQIDAVAVSQLRAGESRVVSAELGGVGQWTVLTAHATFRPPAEVEGTQLSPLTRDVTVFVFPWLVVAGLLLAGIAFAVVQLWRSRRDAEADDLAIGVPA